MTPVDRAIGLRLLGLPDYERYRSQTRRQIPLSHPPPGWARLVNMEGPAQVAMS